METTLAILMVLGIFVGIPAVIGFAIAGTYLLSNRQAKRAHRAKVTAKRPTETVVEALLKPAQH